jgi:peptidoglycan/xylan/chitin deacetylase (PgdA/CDA1 family)
MLRTAFSLLSPAGGRGRLSTLIFHRVHASPDPMFPGEPDARRFDAICGWLANWFNVLPLDEALVRLRQRTLPARAACITFDDGYADNHDVALPILRRHRLPATFFIATGFLDGGRMFNDGLVELVRRSPLPALEVGGLGLELPAAAASLTLHDAVARRAAAMALIGAVKYRPAEERLALVDALRRRAGVDTLPDDLMMRSEQLRALHRAGMGIGAHTVTHPILATLPDDAARSEIQRGKSALEAIVGAPVTLFAYPNGRPRTDYTEQSVRIVRELGFAAAVSTAWGRADAGTDLHQVPRFTPWDASGLRFGLRLLVNLRREPQLLDAPA